MIRVLVLLSFLGLIAKSNVTVAEDNSTLHDGRPFRKDAQGVEIIDYVAELEQSVTYLKERVRELEQQVETSNHTITRLKEEMAVEAPRAIAEPKLFEADLDITPGKEEKKTEVKPAIVKDEPKVAEPKMPVVEKVKKEEAPKKEEITKELVKEEPKKVEPVAIPVIAPKMPEIEKPQQKLEAKPKEIKVVNITPAAVAPAVVKPTPKRLDPVDLARIQVRKEVTNVRQLRVERDNEFKKYLETPASSNALKVSPSKAVSKRGNSIERLESAINLATRERDLYQIRTELGQIKLILSDDIALIRRISKKTQ